MVGEISLHLHVALESAFYKAELSNLSSASNPPTAPQWSQEKAQAP